MNPALIGGGGAFIGQPPIGPMFPVIPPYMLQPQFGIPNAPAQLPQQVLFQPNGGQMNPGVNVQQPQGDMLAGAVPRFRRALHWRTQDNSFAQVTSSPGTTEHHAAE
ncbi:secretory calcium-binding phosphoprotein 9 [Neoarius graeffei]|uniref:secretory calcium-binding phosphoprotein 9 n=1 Tax=Neoarius graeffei TaxID=443677 RepID=UPI00298D0801|nr:secretory calcium-binding phosphoprotein 9 [Neoarius graeffei]